MSTLLPTTVILLTSVVMAVGGSVSDRRQQRADVAVRGRVIDAISGGPVSGATVVLESDRSATTSVSGADGSFVFPSVRIGVYRLKATKPYYSGGGYGQTNPTGVVHPLEIEADRTVEGIRLRLWKYAAITGRVLDDSGEPAVHLPVYVLERSFALSPPRLVLAKVRAARTDDKGQYRLPVPAGEYAVAVKNGDGTAAQATFFPDSPWSRSAEVLRVRAGEERVGVDFRLRERTGRVVRGRITGESHRNWQVDLVPVDPGDWSELEIIKGEVSGEAFSFARVPDGEYTLRAVSFPPKGNYRMIGRVPALLFDPRNPVVPPAPSAPAYWAERVIAVNERGPTDLMLEPQVGAAISGRFVFEGSREGPPADTLLFTPVYVERLDGTMLDGIGIGRIEPDGTFRTASLPPGTYRIRTPKLGGLFLVSATIGTRASDGRITVGPADVTNVTFRYSDTAAALTGVVTDREGRRQPNITVLLFPRDARLWTEIREPWQRLREAATNARGEYRIGGVLEGEYLAVALNQVPSDWRDPTFLKTVVSEASSVKVSGNAPVAQELKVTRR
jgi:hypothetical protein